MDIDEIVEICDKETLDKVIKGFEERVRANGISDPRESSRIWAQLGHLYHRRCDVPSARFAFKQARWFDPENIRAIKWLEKNAA